MSRQNAGKQKILAEPRRQRGMGLFNNLRNGQSDQKIDIDSHFQNLYETDTDICFEIHSKLTPAISN